MVRSDVAGRKVSRATAWLRDAETLLSTPFAELF